ncbi:MAG: hypothetical protein ACRDQT_05890 [Gaiellaceae bacterium]
MYRTITPIAVLGAALALAVPAAFGKGQPVEPQWMQALELRSEALNRQHGLGEYDQAIRALEARSQELNRTYQLGAYSTQSVTKSLDARERSMTAGRDRQPMSAIDARERAFAAKREVQLTTGVYPDVFERAVAARGTGGSILDQFNANDNRHGVEPTNQPATVSAAGSGDEVEWPQIGIGFGVGIALAFGLLLALRMTRQTPLAH